MKTKLPYSALENENRELRRKVVALKSEYDRMIKERSAANVEISALKEEVKFLRELASDIAKGRYFTPKPQ
jgi:hypothetical protein